MSQTVIEIPPITDPMGKYWDQPKVESIIVDEKYALMSRQAFKELAEYNTSYPSGAYVGKMWKKQWLDSTDAYGGLKPHEPETWYLMWFGHSQKPNSLSVNAREILIV